MTERFKFRIWDKIDERFMSGSILIDCRKGCMTGNMPEDKYVVQQCTGIKDVKGNLIYEGDILKVVNGSINGIGLSNKWEVKWVGNGWNIAQWTFDSTHSYEVIGNIYENPELLGQKNGK